jgi:hypothetical protein
MTKKNKQTKGMAIELDNSDRANLREIQARYILVGADKTLVQIAQDCLKIGIAIKIKEL